MDKDKKLFAYMGIAFICLIFISIVLAFAVYDNSNNRANESQESSNISPIENGTPIPENTVQPTSNNIQPSSQNTVSPSVLSSDSPQPSVSSLASSDSKQKFIDGINSIPMTKIIN